MVIRKVSHRGPLAANSVAQATRVISGIVGAGLAGLIIGLAGVFWPAFVLDGLSFLASFVLILGLPAVVGRITPSPAATPASTSAAATAGPARRASSPASRSDLSRRARLAAPLHHDPPRSRSSCSAWARSTSCSSR